MNMNTPETYKFVFLTRVDQTVMKNIVLLLIGSLLFMLCYQLTRRQTAYVNANSASVQPFQKPNTGPAFAQSDKSLVMQMARF
jgi:hypothetical protein